MLMCQDSGRYSPIVYNVDLNSIYMSAQDSLE